MNNKKEIGASVRSVVNQAIWSKDERDERIVRRDIGYEISIGVRQQVADVTSECNLESFLNNIKN